MQASTVSLGAAVTRFATCVDISFTFVVLPYVLVFILRICIRYKDTKDMKRYGYNNFILTVFPNSAIFVT